MRADAYTCLEGQDNDAKLPSEKKTNIFFSNDVMAAVKVALRFDLHECVAHSGKTIESKMNLCHHLKSVN